MFEKSREKLAELISPGKTALTEVDSTTQQVDDKVNKLAESLRPEDYVDKSGELTGNPFTDSMILSLGGNCGIVKAGNHCKKDLRFNLHDVDYIIHHMAGIQSIIGLTSQLIMASGLVIVKSDGQEPSEAEQDKLTDWLTTKNSHNETNQMVIKTAIEAALGYGHSGIRYVEDMKDFGNVFYYQNPRLWKLFTVDSDYVGIRDIAFYEVRVKGKGQKTETKKATNKENTKDITDTLKFDELSNVWYTEDKKQIFIPPENFIHLKLNSNNIYGESPLSFDRQRIQLVIDSFNANIDDVNNDGIGRLILQTTKHTNTAGGSTGSIISDDAVENMVENARPKSVQERNIEVAKRETQALSSAIKTSGKDSVITLNGDMFDEVERLPRITKSTEYLDFMEKSIVVAANIYGIHPGLFGAQNTSYASSMQPILEFTVNNFITPYQNIFSIQLNDFIKKAAGITGDVKFAPYDTNDPKVLAEINKLIAETGRQFVDMGINTDAVQDYIDNQIDEIEIADKGEKLRLFASTLSPVDDTSVTE